jgi:hypothetical protein
MQGGHSLSLDVNVQWGDRTLKLPDCFLREIKINSMQPETQNTSTRRLEGESTVEGRGLNKGEGRHRQSGRRVGAPATHRPGPDTIIIQDAELRPRSPQLVAEQADLIQAEGLRVPDSTAECDNTRALPRNTDYSGRWWTATGRCQNEPG